MRRLKTLIRRGFPRSFGCARLLGPSGVRSVVYHDVSAGDGEFVDRIGVSTSPERFEEHLSYYAKNYDVIGLDALLGAHRLPRRPLLISFDDAYRSVLTTAAPALKRRSLPAVMFVTTDAVGERSVLLENLLSHLAHRVEVGAIESAVTGAAPTTSYIGELVMNVLAGLPYEARARVLRSLCDAFDVDSETLAQIPRLYLEPSDLPALEADGVEIACHGRTHVHLRSCTAATARSEVEDSKRTLEGWVGHRIRAFAVPYGRREDATDVVVQAVASAGYEALFLAEGLANRASLEGRVWNRTVLADEDERSLYFEIEVMPRLRARRRPLDAQMRMKRCPSP